MQFNGHNTLPQFSILTIIQCILSVAVVGILEPSAGVIVYCRSAYAVLPISAPLSDFATVARLDSGVYHFMLPIRKCYACDL